MFSDTFDVIFVSTTRYSRNKSSTSEPTATTGLTYHSNVRTGASINDVGMEKNTYGPSHSSVLSIEESLLDHGGGHTQCVIAMRAP